MYQPTLPSCPQHPQVNAALDIDKFNAFSMDWDMPALNFDKPSNMYSLKELLHQKFFSPFLYLRPLSLQGDEHTQIHLFNKRDYTLKHHISTTRSYQSLSVSTKGVNRIRGTVVYTRPLKQQASLWAHDLTRKHELVGFGHSFGKVSVLATMQGNFHLKKLELTLNADQLKFKGRLDQTNMNLIGRAIIAFVHS